MSLLSLLFTPPKRAVRTILPMKRGLVVAALVSCAVLSSASASPAPPSAGPLVEVVVGLGQPSLAAQSLVYRAMDTRRTRRLDLYASASQSYLDRLEAAQ